MCPTGPLNLPEKSSFNGRHEVEFPMSFLSKATHSVTAGPEQNSWLKVGKVRTEINCEQLMLKWEKYIHITNKLTVSNEVGIIHMGSRTDVCLLNLPW